MDRLSAMRTFVTVVETGSFSRAAQKLGMANASVTEAVKHLEEHLGIQLLNRTTRSVRPTSEGVAYFARCNELLNDVEELEAMVADSRTSPKGRLRVQVPASLGHQFVVPALREFAEKNPDIKITLLLDPGPKSLVEAGIDVSLQFGDLEDSNFIARKIANAQHVACASPKYLAIHGHPKEPADLARMNCLGFFAPQTGRLAEWSFRRNGKSVLHLPDGTPNFNSSSALIDLASRGGGVIYTLDLLVKNHLAQGLLQQVLSDWQTPSRPLYVVYPQKRYLPGAVRTFLSFIDGLELGAQE